ncbi:hypothetical protein Sp245p_07485 [Azospirillum baldaniorum]|uniref:Uncharacterized protein n=1 Tax=Azospirillum baldaniorum TaxID=1064539 RepID=A0A9P1JRM8_9PROT|nr:hypothetical protein [Azospirillum baldaniorum]AWJ89637.1 hypothetical protein Sp245p_07485 [Azospirillum baldaniorum]TWA76728.1 hypothetical protein FBZ85_108141 [Azospirillum brasilense]CCC98431.1 protein of unknown function [Azospirillum baldaniorum]
MAQILAFPGKTQTGNTLSADVLSIEGHTTSFTPANSQIDSATADFDRMMAHHSDLQRKMAEFNRLCEQALAERPMAELLYHPTACSGSVGRA